MKIARILSGTTCLLLSHSLLAENWPQWRGPNFNGSSDEKNLPTTISKEAALWKADLPGPSAATPAIWDDKVFVSSPDLPTKTLHAMCFDRRTGKLLWDQKVGEGLSRDRQSNFASPSPVADATRVFFYYGNGDLAAFDHAGKPIWSRSITKDYGDFAFQWTYAASPTLYNGKLYVEVLQRNVPVHGRGKTDGPIDSFLLALNPGTGATLWKQVRPSDAVQESREAYSTPIPFDDAGRHEILIAGGDCLTAHDPETGKEIWRWATYDPRKIESWRLVPSPSPGAGVVLICAPKGDPIFAIKAGGNGTMDESAVAWKSEKRVLSSDVATPLFYLGDFFVINEGKKSISRVDPKTGSPKWTLDLPGFAKFESSPTGADGKLYLMNFAGEVFILDAVKGEILTKASLGEDGDDQTRSAIAVSHGQLFIRTNHKLFCVGGK